MMEHEQVRPLAPSADRTSSDDEEAAALLSKKLRRRKCIKCCGCITAVLLVPAIVIVILIFTIFRVKDPSIRLNGVIITQLELINNTIPKPGVNMSMIVDVSVKNPNIASFRYRNTTSGLYYNGELVGEARGPPGHAKARRTMRMNLTVDIITDELISNPNLNTEVSTGLLTMDSYSKIPGKVKLLKIIKKQVTVKMNCSITVNISTQAIQAQKCRNKVDL